MSGDHTQETPIDAAFREQERSGDEASALRFHERILDAELFVILSSEPSDGRVTPEVFEVEDGRYVLSFDTVERLAEFVVEPKPYIALSGRSLVSLIEGKGLGIALNLGSAPSATLLPATAVDWMNDVAESITNETHIGRLSCLRAPTNSSDSFRTGLGETISALAPVISHGVLFQAVLGNIETLVLGIVDAPSKVEEDISETLAAAARSSTQSAAFEVMFLNSNSEALAAIEKIGWRIEPQRVLAQTTSIALGSDPAKPPILR